MEIFTTVLKVIVFAIYLSLTITMIDDFSKKHKEIVPAFNLFLFLAMFYVVIQFFRYVFYYLF